MPEMPEKLVTTKFPSCLKILGSIWRIWGDLEERKWTANSIFEKVFGDAFLKAFSIAFWHQLGVVFWRLETWKIAIFFQKNNDFYKIDVFKRETKKTLILETFSETKTM